MPPKRLLDLVRPELAELKAYVPVDGAHAVRLDANEAPALLSAHARARLAAAAAETAWERYPDARLAQLRQTIAEHSGVTPDEVLIGVGSDEVITMLLTALSRPRSEGDVVTIVTTTPTFVMYRMSARARGMRVVEVPLDAAWDVSEEGMLRAVEMMAPNLVFVASPNNPTGTMAHPERLERIVRAASGALVVIDEAYVDYASRDQLELYRRHTNVAILRTLSKVGFAALRVGWLLGRPELVREVDKTRLPYNVPTVSQRLAALVLDELADEIRELASTVKAERERVATALRDVAGVELTPSEANFLWLKTQKPAGEVFDRLAERGVLVRSFHERGGRLAHQLRVTIGAPHENDAFLSALGEVM